MYKDSKYISLFVHPYFSPVVRRKLTKVALLSGNFS